MSDGGAAAPAAVKIAVLAEDHFDRWLALYNAYAEYYRTRLTAEGARRTWGWLRDPAHPLTGLGAFIDGEMTGIAHYRAMPSPLRGCEIGFLDDLFVDPNRRGQGAGMALLRAVEQAARRQGWPVLRWITRDDNYRARALYDRIADKTDWNTYEISLTPTV